MFTMRPPRAAFIAGATACEKRNAPVTLTSKIFCQSASETSSSGWPTWPSTPPALFTRMSTRPVAANASATNASAALLSLTSTRRAAHAPPAATQSRCVSSSSSSTKSQAQTLAPRWANARLMARPKPCAAPVTMAVLPSNAMFIRHGGGARRGEQVQRVERLRADAVLDVVNELDQALCERRRHAGLAPEGRDDSELRVDFRAPLADGQIAPDSAMRLGRAPVECDEIVERTRRGVGRGIG